MNLTRRLLSASCLTLAVLSVVAPAGAQEIVVEPTKPSAVYAVGEEVTWKVSVKGDAANLTNVTYSIRKHGLNPMQDGALDLSAGPATVTSKLDEPGALLLSVRAKKIVNSTTAPATPAPTTNPASNEVRALGGAIVEPEKVKPVSAAPDDFDAFWAEKVKELQAVPVNAKIEPGESEKPDVDYFKVTMDNIRGSHVYGQLAKPKKEGKFPALLLVQYAGVYGLPKGNVTNHAANGWLVLNIIAHDIPFDQPKEFYDAQNSGPLKGYINLGNDNRETSYFLRMYLSCYRAADYLASRDDWDGKTLVVMGGSQGGQQAFVTAGLHPKVTAMLANVPAGCDITAPLHGRAAGFPNWVNQSKAAKKESIVETGRYYDAANFAARVKVPALVSLGAIDETCPPTGILAAINSVQGPTKTIVMPLSDHQGRIKDSQKPWHTASGRWLKNLVNGDQAFPE